MAISQADVGAKSNNMKTVITILFFLLYTSCTKDKTQSPSSCPYQSIGEGRYVFAPDSAKVDSNIYITQLFENHTACQFPNGFVANINGSTREIWIETTIDTCNCDNSQTGDYFQNYVFTIHNPGMQIVKTRLKQNIFQSDTIIVY